MYLPFPLWLFWSVLMFVYHLLRPWFSPNPGGIQWQNQQPQHRTCDAVADLLFEHANEFRVQNGLPTLCRNNGLDVAAWNHAYRMGVTGQFEHVLTDGLEPADRVARTHYRFLVVRENIAWTNSWESPERIAMDIHEGWVASPGHCENLLAEDVTEIGVAVVKCLIDGRYFLVQNFAAPMAIQFPTRRFVLRPAAHVSPAARPKQSRPKTFEQFVHDLQ